MPSASLAGMFQMGMLKKAASLRQGYGGHASGVPWLRTGTVALLPCSRTPRTFRASSLLRRSGYEGREWLWPCWTDFFEHSLRLMMAFSS